MGVRGPGVSVLRVLGWWAVREGARQVSMGRASMRRLSQVRAVCQGQPVGRCRW